MARGARDKETENERAIFLQSHKENYRMRRREKTEEKNVCMCGKHLISARVSQYDYNCLQHQHFSRERRPRQNAQLAQCNISIDAGTMAQVYPHCHKFLFPEKNHQFLQYKGRVRIGNLQPLPNELLILYSNGEPIANRFRKNIRYCNCHFQMTPFGAEKAI